MFVRTQAVSWENPPGVDFILKMSFLFLKLDADEDSPNFDEDGRDEYNEIHMLV